MGWIHRATPTTETGCKEGVVVHPELFRQALSLPEKAVTFADDVSGLVVFESILSVMRLVPTEKNWCGGINVAHCGSAVKNSFRRYYEGY